MNFRTFDQLSLYYETHGDPTAPPIVLIHGLGADHEMWRPQIVSLPGAGYFVIIPDLRGHGASEAPAAFRIADCARDLRDLLSTLQLQRAHLIGVSMGGMVAQQFVARLLSIPPSQALAARLEVNRFTLMDALPHMRLPTLVLVGDGFGKMAIGMARTTAANIPGARLQILPGGGDPSNLLTPAAFDKAVLEFLTAL